MKEEDIDKRIERAVESVASKKAAMRQWESDRISSEKQRKIAAKRWRTYGISVAASVVVICGIGLGIVLNRGGGDNYGVKSPAPIYRGGSCDISDIHAMIDSDEYDKALQAIDATLADTIIDSTYTKERQEYLRSVYKNQRYELTWLKIQALVKLGKEKEAISILEDYVQKQGINQTEAKMLLEKLKK